LKSTETRVCDADNRRVRRHFSNFGSLKSTETATRDRTVSSGSKFQQFRLVEEH